MTPNSWFEVTPESIAVKIASTLLSGAGGGVTVIDAFCGIGGNTLAFAAHPSCERVVAVDTCPSALYCAERNAALYGVQEKIGFVEGDFFDMVGGGGRNGALDGADIVFASPPWGGPGYRVHEVFDVEGMKPYSFEEVWWGVMVALGGRETLVERKGKGQGESPTSKGWVLERGKRAAFFMPRTSDLDQLAKYVASLWITTGNGDEDGGGEFCIAGEDEDEGGGRELVEAKSQAVHYCCSGKSKAVCLYIGLD